tara:strand:- start:4746 stop:5129 length:384 start_codon:yes stop_codon:yes gene_type:complete
MLEKAWAWLKTYWYVPALLIYTVVLMVVFRKDDANALGVLEASKDSYKKQINVLNETHESELKKRDEIIKKYNKTIEQIESQHADESRKLDAHKKRRVKKLIEENHEDPEHLTRLLSLTFGIHHEEG